MSVSLYGSPCDKLARAAPKVMNKTVDFCVPARSPPSGDRGRVKSKVSPAPGALFTSYNGALVYGAPGQSVKCVFVGGVY